MRGRGNAEAEWLRETEDGNSIILRAWRPFATEATPQPAWFTVEASGGPVTVTGAAFSAEDPHELILTLSRDPAAHETVTVSYRRPPGAAGLWDVDGYQLADVEDVPVNMNAGAPRPAGASVSGATLVLTFDEELDEGSAPAGSAFTVTATPADGEARAIAGTGTAAVAGTSVTVTLAEAVGHGETVTVAYAPPDDNPVRDLAGSAAAGFAGELVANGTPADGAGGGRGGAGLGAGDGRDLRGRRHDKGAGDVRRGGDGGHGSKARRG